VYLEDIGLAIMLLLFVLFFPSCLNVHVIRIILVLLPEASKCKNISELQARLPLHFILNFTPTTTNNISSVELQLIFSQLLYRHTRLGTG
jgi:hypothetical protein